MIFVRMLLIMFLIFIKNYLENFYMTDLDAYLNLSRSNIHIHPEYNTGDNKCNIKMYFNILFQISIIYVVIKGIFSK